MSRVQLLCDLVQDLRTVADDVQAIADALMQTDDVPTLPEQKAIFLYNLTKKLTSQSAHPHCAVLP